MSIVKFSYEGKNARLDVESGHVFDESGNTIAKFEQSEDADREALASYAAKFGKQLIMSNIVNAGGGDRMIRLDNPQGPSDVHMPSAMPNVEMGYKLAEGVADIVAPIINVAKDTDSYNVWDVKDAFQLPAMSETSDGGSVVEVSPRVSRTPYKTVARAYGSFVKQETIADADVPLKPLQAAVRRCQRAAAMAREYRVMQKARSTGSYGTNQQISLNSTQKWNGGASSDPIDILHGLIRASFMPVTRIVMSEQVMHAFVENTAVRSYYFAKTDLPGVPTAQQLQSTFGLPPITVAAQKMMLSSNTALDYVYGGDVVLLHEPPQNPPTDQEDIMSFCTFRWNGGGAPDGSLYEGGYLVRTYFDAKRGPRGGTMTVVVHNDAEQSVAPLVGGLIVGAYQ